MKLLPLLALAALTTTAFATKDGWIDDLEKATTQAKAEHKKILLDFTGSDWCGWCKKLDAEVFSTPEFKDYAAKHYVLMEVDFPHHTPLSDATKKQNEKLQAKYGIEGYPTIVVITPGGLKRGQLGYAPGGPTAFIKELEKAK